MPVYTYECFVCQKREDAYRSIADRYLGPDCHGRMNKIIVPPMLQPIIGGGNFPGYKCPVTDQWVTSRKQRRNIVAEHNLIEKG